MGMKNKSGYFAGNTSTGGPAIRQGLKFKLNIQYFAEMPKTKAQFDHIMSDRRGHLANTPSNVSRVLEIANDESNFVAPQFMENVYILRQKTKLNIGFLLKMALFKMQERMGQVIIEPSGNS